MSRSGFHHLPGLQATAMTHSKCVLGRENRWFGPREEVSRKNIPRGVVESSSLVVFKMLLNRVLENLI